MVRSLKIIVFVLLIPFSAAYSQNNPNNLIYNTSISAGDTSIDIGNKFVIQSSDKLILDSNIVLSQPKDYKFDYRNGIITLSRSLFSEYNLDTGSTYKLEVEYDLFPYSFKEEYSNFDIVMERDTITGDTVQIATQKTDLLENLFEGTDLEKSGSIFRGFTFGSNRDVSLKSGFRLQLNGKLARDVEITAALTDEDTPIQPEGNTQKLQELDKVFIEVRSNNITSTIGDIDINFDGSEFVKFNRKIQGAKGYGSFGFGDVLLSGAVSRGKFNTNSFTGIDGVQGPYRLTGIDNEVSILVLSGSEKVYIDGILMTRGESADYTIDYGIGGITFTNKRVITVNTRIVVDFEYSNQRYSRTLLAGENNLKFLDNKLTLGVSYVNEFDSKTNTIDFELSNEDITILEQSGSNRFAAVKSGVSRVGVDTATGIGNGFYILVSDSIVNNNADTVSFYRFAPGTDSSIYQVSFSYVGEGKGNYVQRSTVRYDFSGLNKGNYDTLVFIPIPTAYQVVSANLNFSPTKNKNLYINLESAYSYLDGNLYSESGSSKNGGVALNGTIGFNRNNFRLFGMDVKNLDVSFKNQLVNRSFNSLDRINSVEFSRNFDIQDSSKLTENLSEGNLSFSPSDKLNVRYNFGQLLRGDDFTSTRNIGNFLFGGDSINLPRAKYTIELLNSEDRGLNIKGNWVKHFADIGYKKVLSENPFGDTYLQFKVNYNKERKENSLTNNGVDSLQFGSFEYDEIIPYISINNVFHFDLIAEFNYRKDRKPNSGTMIDLSNTYTQRYGIVYRGLQWASASIDVAVQDKSFTNDAIQLGNTDNQSVLVNSSIRLDPFDGGLKSDLYYKVASERTAKVDRIFVFVGAGKGNYIYVGDINNNGLQDENEFKLTNFDGDYIRLNIPLNEFFPIVDLQTSARINFKPAKFFNIHDDNFIGSIFNNLTMESFFRVDEKSQDPNTDDIYFLRFSTFLNETNTLQGLQLFQQDIKLFENNTDYSLRFRFLQTKGYSQLSNGNERTLNIQKSVTLKLGLTEDISAQLDFLNVMDRDIIPVTSIRNRNIKSNGVTADFSYNPIQAVESGFSFNFSRATDFFPPVKNDADINQQILRFVYSFLSAGRLRIELERDEVLISNESETIPYELTNGRVAGKSYFWRGIFDYSLTKNIQASINYNGRLEGQRKVIHTGQAQLTAFF